MAHWYTADTHFGHENVIRFCNRPFANTADMDVTMLKNLADRVGPDDDLWVLGDFAFGRKAKDASFLSEIFEQLPGARKHLITGNHEFQPTLELGWDTVTPFMELRDGPQNQLNTLCHYPMITWNHARRGALQFFGHVHDNWKGSFNSVNVGVDVWDFMPVGYDDIAKRAASLPKNAHWNEVEPS